MSNLTLDVGCGRCKYGDIGIDILNSSEADIICSVYDMPFLNSTFSQVNCFEVMEHLDNPSLALKEIKRVLKSNGTLIITIPNAQYILKIAAMLINIKDHVCSEHINHWRIPEVTRLLNRAGFNVIAFDYTTWRRCHGKEKMKCILPRHLRHCSLVIFANKMEDTE